MIVNLRRLLRDYRPIWYQHLDVFRAKKNKKPKRDDPIHKTENETQKLKIWEKVGTGVVQT